MPGLPGYRARGRGLNVEAFQYVEDSHVLRVFFFHVLQSFQDNRRKSATGGS